jgi:Domain of unknown function (DUF4249)
MNKLIIALVILLAAGCKEKFLSPVPDIDSGFLVVEGVINNGGGETNIKLSRTTSLENTDIVKEKGATVILESNNNITFFLSESNEGTYTINNLQLDTSLLYRLAIKTINNEEYYSDYVPVRNNPPIDSISWVRESDGVQLYINTHDPNNNTRYYQWEFEETWEFHSTYTTSLKYIIGPAPLYLNIGAEFRTPFDPQISTCWKYNSSTSLILGSSAKLTEDIIHLPLIFIENGSQQLSVLYSVEVNQYAWSKQGYDFLERMKKNTESVGSVFDPQPSELNGNIHCVSNPSQPVIGFFNICTIQKNRIFIKRTEVPDWAYTQGCFAPQLIENHPDSITKKAAGLLPTVSYDAVISKFFAAQEECVDCTRTGSNVKPIYWP